MDYKALEVLRAVSGDKFSSVIQLILSSTDKNMNNLDTALRVNDAGNARQAAHSLKGSFGQVGSTELFELMSNIETMAEKNDLQGIRTLQGDIREKFVALKTFLARLADLDKNS